VAQPLKQGADVVVKDVAHLTRMIRRVREDQKRPKNDRDEIVEHLRAAIVLLLESRDALEPISKRASKK